MSLSRDTSGGAPARRSAVSDNDTTAPTVVATTIGQGSRVGRARQIIQITNATRTTTPSPETR